MRAGSAISREALDSTGRFAQTLLGEPPGADGLHDPGVDAFGAKIVAEAQQVRAGLQSKDGSFLLPDRAADRAHLQGVGDDDAVEAELAPEEIRDHRTAEGARRLVEPGHANVGGHHRAHSGAHGRAKRQQHRGHRLVVALDRRELEMRVLLGVAVPREVLRAGRDSGALEPTHERGHVAGDELRVAPERADADDRVVGIRVHVRDRGEIEVDARGGQFGADGGCDVARELDVVDCTERVVPWIALPVEASSRLTSPPSSSIATIRSGRSLRSSAVSFASCSRLSTFHAKRQTPPSPPSSQGRTQAGTLVPSNPTSRQRAASRSSSTLTRERRPR